MGYELVFVFVALVISQLQLVQRKLVSLELVVVLFFEVVGVDYD